MINLYLVELKFNAKQKKKVNNYFNNSLFGQNQFLNFVISEPLNQVDKKIEVSFISKELSKGIYGIPSEFSILFLYDYFDDECRNFMKNKAQNVHNISDSTISIITFLSEDDIKYWDKALKKDKIKPSCIEPFKVDEIMLELQKVYRVSELPAVVVLGLDNEGNEQTLGKKILKGYSEKDLFVMFQKMINIIRNDPIDYKAIREKLGSIELSTKGKSKSDIMKALEEANYIKKLKKIKMAEGILEPTFKVSDLASELGISERTLRNKQNGSFKRDECFYMALRFNLNENETNKLLKENKLENIKFGDREGIILDGLTKKQKVEEVNERLRVCGYQIIDYPKN